MLKLKKGLCLESLRQPLKKALVTAAGIGADGVEINARTELRPADLSRTGVRHLKKMLGDLNLEVSAIHFPTRRGYEEPEDLERRINATKQAIDMAYQLGAKVVTNRIGWVPEDLNDSRGQNLVQALTEIGLHSQRSGAWLAARTAGESGEALKGLIDHLPPMSLGVDFDPAEYTMHGQSSDQALRTLGGHVMNFRARDGVRDLSLGRGLEVQLGRGSVDLPGLLGLLEENRYQGYITIERDSESEPVVQCAQSIEYLDNLFSG